MFNRSDIFEIQEPEIIYNSNKIELKCSYACDDYEFVESFLFKFPNGYKIVNQELNLIANLVSVAAATSYYKAFRAKKIKFLFPVTPMTEQWAKQLFDNGLREFRFVNNIDLIEEIQYEFDSLNNSNVLIEESNTVLIPIGGGKDSVTTIEIAKNSGKKIIGFSVGDFKAINDCAEASQIELVKVTRTLDEQIIRLNKEGRPNGHIPVTAITSTLACMAALALGISEVAMSNENSANESTRVVDGVQVNHQWSKTFDAETLLRNALSSCSLQVNYYSALRSMSEFEIFELFSDFEKYHKAFTSCNRAFKLDENSRAKTWCCNCEKCRFVFLGLSAFKGAPYAAEIIGSQMFDDEDQIQGFLDLIDSSKKPFECVGTISESRTMARNCLIWDIAANSKVGKAFSEILIDSPKLEEKVAHLDLTSYAPKEIIDSILDLKIKHFKSHLKNHLADETFSIMGLGRDTSAIVKFLNLYGGVKDFQLFLPPGSTHDNVEIEDLRKEFSLDQHDINIVKTNNIGDINDSIVFVSPGISKYSKEVKYLGDKATTPLAWWLEYMQLHFPMNIFIGVTGTKGKSTVASMLDHVLDKSVIAGNLGIGVGDISLEQLFGSKYIVLEVSSFQSSYVVSSPDIVAFTSLFDCHIDWHLTPENYRNDKFNLAMNGASEIVASDSIEDLSQQIMHLRKQSSEPSRIDVISLVPSSGKTLKQRNHELVKTIISLADPTMSVDEIEHKLSSFKDLEHRQELIDTKNGVHFISDVLSTAPLASLLAVDDVKIKYENATIFLLSGGIHRNEDLEQLILGLNERCEFVFTIALPQTGHMIEEKLERYLHADNLEDGINIALSKANDGDVILLAPGAPSFHLYKNYVELAKHFKEIVNKI
ncbi:MAG: Mur ligase family protein [Acidimicrobiia bacterium]